MFNEKELRIGSLVFNKDKRVCSVTHVQLDGNSISVSISCRPPGHMVENISAIPLTEEILLKANFKKEYNTKLPNEASYDKDGIVLNQNFQLSTYNGGVSIIGKRIEYVHQLQNLYITLSGDELGLQAEDF